MANNFLTKIGRHLFSRGSQRVMNNLGTIKLPMPDDADKLYREFKLEVYDAYYESRQYNHLYPWTMSCDDNGDHIPIRQRRPQIIYNFAKVMSSRLTSKLIGNSVWPTLEIEDDPSTTEYLQYIVKASKIKHKLLEPIRRMINCGSVFVRFFSVDGVVKFEWFSAKYAYPKFKENGDLESCMIRYVYTDKKDKDEMGNPKRKWFRMDLGEMQDVVYDNPEYKPEQNIDAVQFQVVESIPHGFGFVQGEFLRTSESRDQIDGVGLICEILDFVDALNYSLSQSDNAVSYNQDPQLLIKGMDEEEIGELIRSSAKAWTLGREGEASFLESNLNGVETAMVLRDKIRTSVQDLARVILLDPEKMVAHAQSGKAMEILHGPMVELINELRPVMEDQLKRIILKLAVMNLVLGQRGEPQFVTVPPGFAPSSLDIALKWPPIFEMTTQDKRDMVSMVSQATSANLISRETGTRQLAPIFQVEDIEEELQKIEDQPVINPFGGF